MEWDGADDGLRGQDGAADEQHVRLLLAERVDAREEADLAAGAVVGVGFFGFTTTFFSGALRLVPAAAAAVFFGLAVPALFFGFAAALAGLAAMVLAAAGLALGASFLAASESRRAGEAMHGGGWRRCRKGRSSGAVASRKGRRARKLHI